MAGYIGKGQPLVSNGAEKKFKYTATAGQTTFNASYTVGSVHVYRTGVRLTDGVDYTATNGTSVVLSEGANAGDDVVIVATNGFQVADAYTKAELANHDLVTVDASGNVGIGTNSPSEQLEVNGWIKTGQGANYAGGVLFPYTGGSTDSRSWGVRNDIAEYGDFGIAQSATQTGDVTTGGSLVRMRIDSEGRVTMPYQPAFSVAKTNGAQADTNPISFNIIDVNVGNNFNGSRFTAPVSGNYYFNSMLLTNSGLSLNYSLRVNGSMYRTTENTSSNTSYKGVSLSCIVPMNAGDYVELNSNNYSVYGGGGNYSMFTGYLIG